MTTSKPKRPRDPNQLAHLIAAIATGEVDDAKTDDGKNPAAVALGRNGDLPPIEEGVSLRENGAAKITLEVLKGHPDGLTGPDLKVLVGADPAAPKSVAEHGQYIYNVLATLIGSGRVVKNGNLYQALEKVRPRGNGASDTHASDRAR